VTPKSVMLIGGGAAREHALARAFQNSPNVSRVLCVPGNSAVEHISGVETIPVASQDMYGLVELAMMEEVDLTVVGPNTPLIMGIVDKFRAEGLPIFGPTKAAARLEGSKAFAKNFMLRNDIPTARFAVFEDTERANYFCKRTSWGRVIKTDGLAYEKGVEVCHSAEQCEHAIQRIMVDEVLEADRQARVVVEERLEGPEITLCVLSDGTDVLVLDANSNYPRALNDDQGMRTRGMGAISPAPDMNLDLLTEMRTTIVEPTIRGIAEFREPLVGALFIDVIIQRGQPYVLDYNVRFGDPATQVFLARLQSGLFELLEACVTSRLKEHQHKMKVDSRTAVSVVTATAGYPSHRRRGDPVEIDLSVFDDSLILDVGALKWSQEQYWTTGGRVATVTGLGKSVEEATRRAYTGIEKIQFDGRHYRTDIGTGLVS